MDRSPVPVDFWGPCCVMWSALLLTLDVMVCHHAAGTRLLVTYGRTVISFTSHYSMVKIQFLGHIIALQWANIQDNIL